jgi:hypothetical protein
MRIIYLIFIFICSVFLRLTNEIADFVVCKCQSYLQAQVTVGSILERKKKWMKANQSDFSEFALFNDEKIVWLCKEKNYKSENEFKSKYQKLNTMFWSHFNDLFHSTQQSLKMKWIY